MTGRLWSPASERTLSVGEPHRAKKSLGQNFLVDPNLQRKIVEAVGAGPGDTVVEIGPGQGALTEHLEGSVGRLVLVELDNDLAPKLASRFQDRSDVTVVHGDVLDVTLSEYVHDLASAHVVGNIPYNITTPILFHLLTRPRPRDIVLMVQDEVAQRMVAPPGGKTYGALAVGVRTVASVERLFGVGRKAFRPSPRVDSAVIRVTPLRPERLTLDEELRLRVLVRSVFQRRRKQLGKILREHPDLRIPRDPLDEIAAEVDIDLSDRPERLSPDDFVRLSAALAKISLP
jgi:16S rRNA (adenine1518-N6/adenine1519-N6)-dimethyltransferase